MAEVLWFEPIDVRSCNLGSNHTPVASGADIMETKFQVAMETHVSVVYRNKLSLWIMGLLCTSNVLYYGSCHGCYHSKTCPIWASVTLAKLNSVWTQTDSSLTKAWICYCYVFGTSLGMSIKSLHLIHIANNHGNQWSKGLPGQSLLTCSLVHVATTVDCNSSHLGQYLETPYLWTLTSYKFRISWINW